MEGIDGAGKRTLCSLMKNYLESQGYEVACFEYPDYSSIWGRIIDGYLHKKIELDINEQFFVFFIDILKDQDRIYELLNNNIIVITDRYFSSTLAFQCAKDFDFQKALSIIKTMNVIEPDLSLFIQIPPELTHERKSKQKDSLDRHEKDFELLEKVDNIYEKISSQNILSKKWIKVNGNRELNKIEEDIIAVLDCEEVTR